MAPTRVIVEKNGNGKRRRERMIARKFRARVHGPVKVARLLPLYVIVAKRGGDVQSAEMRIYMYTGSNRARSEGSRVSFVRNERMLTLFLPRCNLVSVTLHPVGLVKLIVEGNH